MQIKITDLELKMWEATEMPEALKGADGKMVKDEVTGKIKNTGNKVGYTIYTFRDLMGETLKIMSAKNNFRELENKLVTVQFNLTRKEFGGKTDTRLSLVNVSEQTKK